MKSYIEKKEQSDLLNWLYTSIDLPKQVYEIHDTLNLFNQLDFSLNNQKNRQKIMYIEQLLRQSNEAILQTLKIIEEKKQTK